MSARGSTRDDAAEVANLQPRIRALYEALDRRELLGDDDDVWLGPHGVDSVLAEWDPVDLSAHWDGKAIEADVGWRNDGVAMFYTGKVNLVFGESGSGKSWLALLACAAVLRRGGRVVYFDAEDGPYAIAQRLKVLGVAQEDLNRLTYVNPTSFSIAGRDRRTIDVAAADIVVFDATTEFLTAMGGLSSNTDTDVAQFMADLPKWAARRGPAVVVVDHTAKDTANRNGPQGSQHKRAAIDGAAYYVYPIELFKRTGEGLSRVYLNKDKQGGVASHTAHTKHGEVFADLPADVEGGGFRLDVPLVSAEALLSPGDRQVAKIDAAKARITGGLSTWSGDKPPGSRNRVALHLKEQGAGLSDHVLTKALLDALVESGHLTPGYGFIREYIPAGVGGDEEDDGYAY